GRVHRPVGIDRPGPLSDRWQGQGELWLPSIEILLDGEPVVHHDFDTAGPACRRARGLAEQDAEVGGLALDPDNERLCGRGRLPARRRTWRWRGPAGTAGREDEGEADKSRAARPARHASQGRWSLAKWLARRRSISCAPTGLGDRHGAGLVITPPRRRGGALKAIR